MEKTPLAFRTHVSVFGNTNAGKSSLFNKLIGQEMMIVSAERGTTTDPVTKAMELIPYGPIALTDTAGLGDMTDIGAKRMEKTEKILEKTDFAIYAAPVDDFDETSYSEMKKQFEKKHIEHMLVFTKSDLGTGGLKEKYPDALFVSVFDDSSVESLRGALNKRLSELKTEDDTMIGGLLPAGSTIIMVVPIDSEAPKGRIILPQVQFLRDCLDHGMKTIVVRDTELEETLREQKNVDLVVTDSQAFKFVASVVPESIMLTSFSMMMASMKGDLSKLIAGADAIKDLKDGSKILMAEACTHNSSHEDIGRVKIPKLLQKYTGKKLEFDYYVHQDFPKDLSEYDLVIHCGGCMINSRSMNNRIEFCLENNVPITNYGVVLACVNGILDRSAKIFKK
ncbi:MAG: [FeFe] hydrogenase H-cluster maturation GTPase HydF [Firmicutes bacterium]|nr:[FeFe] hydrogenase H-cluster maturation GTPase HydF [Bacillota bacterium]